MTVLLGSLAFVPVPASTQAANAGTYSVTQGTDCYEVRPLAEQSDSGGYETVETFYDYRNSTGSEYSSHGTQDIQASQVSQVFLYYGAEGTSLVFLHDELNDGVEGGVVTFDISGLPAGEWAIEDDNYPDRDDVFDHDGSTSHIEWVWAPDRTDGAAFRGLRDASFEIRVDPSFNDESSRSSTWSYGDDEIDSWVLRDESGQTYTLNMTRSLTVRPGTCDTSPPPVSLSASPTEADVGTSVSFEATASDDDGIAAYRWDFDGDGTVDARTQDGSTSHVYQSTGEYTARVTAVDGYGNTAEATATVTVGDQSPPEAALSVPDEAGIGETVTLDASDSNDDRGIAAYEWDVDGDGSVEETTSDPTLEWTYDAPGDYSASVTVRDGSDNTDTANATLSVVDRTAPDAIADVPASANTTVSVDGSASTDNGGIAAYEWTFGDGGTATGPQASHSYESPGNYTVSLTVTDLAGNTDRTNATVSVRVPDTAAPAAALSVPPSVGINESVTLDASDSNDDRGIVAYEWDVDGDGSVEETTSDPTLERTYDAPGNYSVSLTVRDGSGNTDTANTTVRVVDSSPPTPSIDLPSTASPDTNVTLDASGSTDDWRIESYDWRIGNRTATGVQVDHRVSEPGEVDVSLTVTDAAGKTATVNETLLVEASSGGAVGGGGGGGGGFAGGGGGGGAAPATSTPTPEPDTSSSIEVTSRANTTVFVVRNPEQGRTQSASIPSLSGAPDGVEYRQLTVVPGTSSAFAVAVSANTARPADTGPVTATDTVLSYLQVEPNASASDGGLDRYGVAFAVDRATIADLGGAPENVSVYRYRDGIWVPVETDVVGGSPDRVRFRANVSDGDGGRFAVGLSHPVIRVASVSERRIEQNGSVHLVADVRNVGHGTGPVTARLAVDGRDLASRTVVVPTNGSAQVAFVRQVSGTETVTLGVHDQRREVSLQSGDGALPTDGVGVTDLTVEPGTVDVGEEVTVRATVRNTGDRNRSYEAVLRLFDRGVRRTSVTVAPGGTRNVTFTIQVESPGTYRPSVGNRSARLVVRGGETPTSTPATTAADGAGFGVAVTALAVALVAAGLRRRGRG